MIFSFLRRIANKRSIPCISIVKIEAKGPLLGIKQLWYPPLINNCWMRLCNIQNNQGRGRAYRSRRLRLITLVKSNNCQTESYDCFIIHWTKQKSHVFGSWLTATRQSEWTWHDYPHESCTAVIHDMIIGDLECPWHDYCIICSYDVIVRFRSIRKEM